DRPLLPADAGLRRFQEDPAVAGTLQKRRLRVRRHLSQLVVADLERLLDRPLDLELPVLRLQLGNLEVVADEELLVGGEEAVEGGEGKFQVVRVLLSSDHPRETGVARWGRAGFRRPSFRQGGQERKRRHATEEGAPPAVHAPGGPSLPSHESPRERKSLAPAAGFSRQRPPFHSMKGLRRGPEAARREEFAPDPWGEGHSHALLAFVTT